MLNGYSNNAELFEKNSVPRDAVDELKIDNASDDEDDLSESALRVQAKLFGVNNGSSYNAKVVATPAGDEANKNSSAPSPAQTEIGTVMPAQLQETVNKSLIGTVCEESQQSSVGGSHKISYKPRATPSKIIPSVAEAFASTCVEFISEPGTKREKTRTKYSCAPTAERVTAAPVPGGPKAEPATETSRSFGLPEAGSWHVPLTFVDVLKTRNKALEEEQRQLQKAEAAKVKETEFLKKRGQQSTVKDKEKVKRQRGQSSHDTWKSESWMKMRQQYD